MTEYTFASWARSGAAASLDHPDDLARTTPVRGRLAASAAVDGGPARPIGVDLYGPADVRSLDPRQIIRVHPPPGTPDADTTTFPLVEFDRSDLPWLFTPLAPGPTGLLRPWLALVCVPAALAPRRLPGRPLPVLRAPVQELPDRSFLHLWAHVQTVTGHQTDPRRSLSRLLSPRRLLAHRDYVACLVPAFEAGRRAGLGDAGGDLSPAWPAVGSAELPVYFSWRFSTGEGGDFETLVDRLRAWPLPQTVGRRALDVSHPGLLAQGPGRLTQQVESALRRTGPVDRPPWPVDAASARWRERLAAALAGTGVDGDEDPVVLPPLYGGFHALRDRVDPAAAGWFTALNLDPRWRVAAGLGARAVQREQEPLMASAWRQLADVRAANRFLDLARLARLVVRRLHRRHVRPLPVDELFQLTTPLLSRALLKDVTFAAAARDSVLPTGVATHAFRRLVRPHGSVAKRLVLTARDDTRTRDDRGTFAGVVTAVASSPVGLAAGAREPDGAVAFNVLPERVVATERLPAVRAALGLTDASPTPWTALAVEAVRRATARDVPGAQLSGAPPIAASVLDASFRLRALPEVTVPRRFFTAVRLTPQGSLLFPSGRTAPAGLAALTEVAGVDGSFAGAWSGRWTTFPDGWTGAWGGECAGQWNGSERERGSWRGTFTGAWDQVNPVGPEGPVGTWRAVFTGTWDSATERGTWQGVATGAWNGPAITSDGTFTGGWRSATRRGSWHGTCPGIWDWDHTGTAGIWRAECTGGWHRPGMDTTGPPGPVWEPDHLDEILDGWRPDNGFPMDQIFDPDYLSGQAGSLPAPAVLDIGAAAVGQITGAGRDQLFRPADAPLVPGRDRFPTAEAHQAALAATDPDKAVAAVVESRVERPEPGGGDTVQWAPRFTDPMWPPLAAQSTEWLLAGLQDVPPDTATVAVTNPTFVEAYLVGLNHEFARELRWREYPTDQRGTYFATFWGAGADIPPLAQWQDDGTALGAHSGGQPERVVLVLRSALLRRYPGAAIYAAPLDGITPDDSRARQPIFRGGLDPQTAFLGFDLTVEQLLASPWCFVIAEQPTEPRFGLDDPPKNAEVGQPYEPPEETVPPTDADDWNNLNWSHLFDRPEALDAATHAPGAPRPNVELNGLRWGSDAAGIARQCFQQPVRVVLPAARLLVPPQSTPSG